MKKVLISLGVIVVVMLAGCSDDTTKSEDKSSEQEEQTSDLDNDTEEVAAEEVDSKPVPIDFEAYVKQYNKYATKFDLDNITLDNGEVVTGNLSINETSLSLILGDLTTANVFLNALADIVEEKEEVFSLVGDMTVDVAEQGFFVDELELSNLNISVNAVDGSTVTIRVTAR